MSRLLNLNNKKPEPTSTEVLSTMPLANTRGRFSPTTRLSASILKTLKPITRKVLLVVELKRGRASDVVVGQVQRYMGYVLEDLAEVDQTVKGAIIALEDDLRLRRALKVTQGIEFYRYQVSFKLTKVVI